MSEILDTVFKVECPHRFCRKVHVSRTLHGDIGIAVDESSSIATSYSSRTANFMIRTIVENPRDGAFFFIKVFGFCFHSYPLDNDVPVRVLSSVSL